MDPVVVENTTETNNSNKRSKYVEKGENTQGAKEGQKEHKPRHEHKKRPKREREQREEDQFKIKASDIDENTVIPKMPKPLLKEPKKQDFKNEQSKIIEKIKVLQEKKSKLHAEKFEPNKKGDKKSVDQYDILRDQVKQLREGKQAAFKELDVFNQKIKAIQDQTQDINNQLSSYGTDKGSTIFDRLRQVENALMTKKLTPKQEKDLTHQRDTIRRKVNAVSQKATGEDVEVRIAQLKEKKVQLIQKLNNLRDEKKPLNQKYTQIKNQYTPLNEKLNALRDQRKADRDNQQSSHNQQYQKFKDQKTEKKEQIQINIDKLRDSIDDLWDDFHAKNNEFWKQKRLVDHINWLTKRKDEHIKFKQRERKRNEEKKEEAPINKIKKYAPHVKNCETLIEYCKKLNPKDEENKQKVVEIKLTAEEIQGKLSEDSQWKKEKGVTLIQSKKSQNQDEQIISKKNKKNKKVEQQDKQANKPKKPAAYAHDIGIRNAFAQVKVLCPDSVNDLQKTIQALEQKLAQYNKLNEQEPAQETTQNSTQPTQAQKPKESHKQKKQQVNKLQIKEDDFPTL